MNVYEIWKFQLKFYGGPIPVAMPEGAKLLTAQMQDGILCVWAVVNPKNRTNTRKFMVVGTGEPMRPETVNNCNYVGTVQQDGFVWHVFEGDGLR